MAVTAIVAVAEGKNDSLREHIMEQSSQLVAMRNEVYHNPAMQSIHFMSSLTTLAAGYSHSEATLPVRLEYGDGHSYGFGDIKAYLHKGKATIWGNAKYYNGTFRNIQFCETSDFENVSPYVMADTVGGDSRREFYHFLGGFSYPLGKFNVGAEGEYTAMLEYRTRDPRPRNLTGDLRLKVGASYSLTKSHLLGVAVSARKYKQTNELKLYNEISVPTIYHSTGLGMDYYRFRGVNTSTYYKGYSVGGMFDFTSVHNDGLFANIDYEYTKIDKIISSLNELPMATMRDYSQNVKVGYGTNSGGTGYGIALTESWSERKGTENIFGTAQDNIYPQISEASQYSLKRFSTGVEAVYQHNVKSGSYSAKLNVEYADYKELYRQPERKLNASSVIAALKCAGDVKTGQMLLSGELCGGYEWNTSSSLVVPLDIQKEKMFTPVQHYFNYLSADRYNISASVKAGYCIKKHFMPFVRLSWQYAHYLSAENRNGVEIAVGVSL